MMFYIELATLAGLGAAVGYIVALRQHIATLLQENTQLKQHFNAIKQELHNANTAKKIDKTNHGLSADDVDEFLQAGGYLRNQ